MILTYQDILELSDSLITPFNEEQVQPSSYDLCLQEAEKEILNPLEFALGTTKETVSIPNYMRGQVKGKSSIARLGLQVECAGLIDPGFTGQITLELFNMSNKPINLGKLKRICQIEFAETKRPVKKTYDGHYQNQQGITESWIKESE